MTIVFEPLNKLSKVLKIYFFILSIFLFVYINVNWLIRAQESRLFKKKILIRKDISLSSSESLDSDEAHGLQNLFI